MARDVFDEGESIVNDLSGVVEGVQDLVEAASDVQHLDEIAAGETPLTFDLNPDTVLDEWPSAPQSGGDGLPGIPCGSQLTTGCATAAITAQLSSMGSTSTGDDSSHRDVGRAIDLISSAIDSAVRAVIETLTFACDFF